MLGVLTRAGHELVGDPEVAEVLVVNTCAFIEAAKQESIDTILALARVKAAGAGRRLVVTGCLAQRYAAELGRALPEVDAFVGTGDLLRIAEAVEADGPAVYCSAPHSLPPHLTAPRVRTGAWWTAYLKISEGCDHTCSFCIIPTIRGRHESRPMADLLAEAESLCAAGAVELNLVAQDSTAYGRDRRDGTSLATLLRALAIRVPQARGLPLPRPAAPARERPHPARDAARAQRGRPETARGTHPQHRAGRRAAHRVHRRLSRRDRGRRARALRLRRRDGLRPRRRLLLLARGRHGRGQARRRRAARGEAAAAGARDGGPGGGVGAAARGAGRTFDRGAGRGGLRRRVARRAHAGAGARDRRRGAASRDRSPGGARPRAHHGGGYLRPRGDRAPRRR